MADTLSPGRSAKLGIVGLRKGVRLRVGKTGPGTRETRGSPGTEVSRTVPADGLNEKKVLTVAGAVYIGYLK